MKLCPICHRALLLTYVFPLLYACDRCYVVWVSFDSRFTMRSLLNVTPTGPKRYLGYSVRPWSAKEESLLTTYRSQSTSASERVGATYEDSSTEAEIR